MDGDVVEIPVQRCLFRQSSIETRLSPQPPPKCFSDSEDEDTPRIIGAIKKKAEVNDDRNSEIESPKDQLDDEFSDRKSLSASKLNVIPVYAEVNKDAKKKKRRSQEFVYYGTVEAPKPQVVVQEVLEKPSTGRLSQSYETDVPFVPVYADVTPTTKPREENFKNDSKNRSSENSDIKQHLAPSVDFRNNQYQSQSRPASYAVVHENIPKRNDSTFNRLSYRKPEEVITQSKSTGVIKTIDTVGNMATLRPKSPRPPVAKQEKEESLWDKIGTLGRKKRIKEVREVEAEGKNAIDSPGNPVMPDLSPEEYELEENEERCMVDPQSLEEPKVRDLIQVLIDWINDELAEQRIIVQDILDDLYDGQVLQKLLERLTGDKLNEPEVTQSEEGQKHKLAMVLDDFNRVLGIPHHSVKKWGVESIHSKNIVAILYLLVALARHFRAPVRLPEHVTIKTIVVQKSNGQLNHRIVHEHVTQAYDDVGMRCERDAFDTLFDHAPDKLQVVKKSMVTFVNKHLNKINLEVTDLESQFSDGVYLVLLMGLLEGFFVPLHCFSLTPKEFDQKVHNVAFAFDLMEEVGISRPKARPEDIVNVDLKSTLRVLYKLFSKYKDIV